jgi:phosphate transport system protein
MTTKSEQRKALAEGLEKLNENMATLAELAELAIRKAVDGLERLDATVADEVFLLDQEVYALQVEIEKSCVDLIALHAPVARDLRMITTSLKITTDLDRIGRYAKDIAEITVQSLGSAIPFTSLSSIPRMADITIEMVDAAINSFLERDAVSAARLQETDDEVDALHDAAFQEIVRSMTARTLTVEVGARSILVSRYLERIADHAVNIGERVVYMVTGARPPRVRAADRAKQKSP